jgi:hypothetical protein
LRNKNNNYGQCKVHIRVFFDGCKKSRDWQAAFLVKNKRPFSVGIISDINEKLKILDAPTKRYYTARKSLNLRK